MRVLVWLAKIPKLMMTLSLFRPFCRIGASLVAITCLTSTAALAQGAPQLISDEVREDARRIVDAAMQDDAGWKKLEHLTTRIGHRLSGSAQLEQAVRWAGDGMKAEGLDNVFARLLYGYELPITELLFRGQLAGLSPKALAVVLVGLVHEERGRGPSEHVPNRLFGPLRHSVERLSEELTTLESRHGIPQPSKSPSWGLTRALEAWYDGASFEEVEELTPATPGEICRTFRMAIQLLRAVRRTQGPAEALRAEIDEVFRRINREEIDARRQLSLG